MFFSLTKMQLFSKDHEQLSLFMLVLFDTVKPVLPSHYRERLSSLKRAKLPPLHRSGNYITQLNLSGEATCLIILKRGILIRQA